MTDRALVTGAAGMLGSECVAAAPEGWDVQGVDLGDFDITDLESTRSGVAEANPDVVLHCAAWTDVDGAEAAEDEALAVNAGGAGNIAAACAEIGARLVCISTDFVFDGTGTEPYVEEDPVAPVGAYGRTKLEGERRVQAANPGAAIVRTQWLYGPRGRHFVGAITAAARRDGALRVVDDQVGCPTSSMDLAPALWRIALEGEGGIYHCSSGGACSWFEFARAIVAAADLAVDVEPVTSDAFPRPAPRPAYSVLDNARLRRTLGDPMRPWHDAFMGFVDAEGLA